MVGPKIEIGVGPGRFAEALGTRFGIDPAFGPLQLAQARHIACCQARGEFLPLRSNVVGAAYLLFTLCFVNEPPQVLAECLRVLVPGGHLVLGLINRQSAWGRMLDEKRRAGHAFYRYARFYTPSEAQGFLSSAGFQLVEARSSLRQPPDNLAQREHSTAGVDQEAGFVILVGKKGEMSGAAA